LLINESGGGAVADLFTLGYGNNMKCLARYVQLNFQVITHFYSNKAEMKLQFITFDIELLSVFSILTFCFWHKRFINYVLQ